MDGAQRDRLRKKNGTVCLRVGPLRRSEGPIGLAERRGAGKLGVEYGLEWQAKRETALAVLGSYGLGDSAAIKSARWPPRAVTHLPLRTT